MQHKVVPCIQSTILTRCWQKLINLNFFQRVFTKNTPIFRVITKKIMISFVLFKNHPCRKNVFAVCVFSQKNSFGPGRPIEKGLLDQNHMAFIGLMHGTLVFTSILKRNSIHQGTCQDSRTCRNISNLAFFNPSKHGNSVWAVQQVP